MADAKKEKVLTPKERIFISEYLVDFNATRAAIKAGYSKKTATAIGSENLRKPHIQDGIGEEVEKILRDSKGLALRVVRECEKIAFGKISDVMEFDDEGVTLKSSDEIDTSTIESISFDSTVLRSKDKKSKDDVLSVKKRVKLYSKEKALEILAKYTALYTDAPKVDLNLNIDEDKVADILARHGVSKSKD
jgi:phage terminase small subunit